MSPSPIDVLDIHSQGGGDPGKGINHHPDQRPVAEADDRIVRDFRDDPLDVVVGPQTSTLQIKSESSRNIIDALQRAEKRVRDEITEEAGQASP